jgi:hypothetical protein
MGRDTEKMGVKYQTRRASSLILKCSKFGRRVPGSVERFPFSGSCCHVRPKTAC